MDIVVVGSEYTLLLYMIMKKDWKNAFYVLGGRLGKNIEHSLAEFGIEYYSVSSGFDREKEDKCKRIMKNQETIIYGHDHLLGMERFIDGRFRVIEDGTANYKGFIFIENSYKLIVNACEYIPFGYDDMIKKVYLTQRKNIPLELIDKMEFVDIKKLWTGKSEKEKNDIFKIYNFDLNNIKKVIGNRHEFLLTAQYSECGMISEKGKIEMYREILNKYDLRNIVIKRHPAERTNYKKEFPDVCIIENPFPFELMFLVPDLIISKIITVDSTAAMHDWNNIRIDYHKHLLEKFSSEKEMVAFGKKRTFVYCYGAGRIGQRFCKFLQKNNIVVKGFLISDDQILVKRQIEGISVYKISEISYSEKHGIILSLDTKYHKEIIKDLQKRGYYNIYSNYYGIINKRATIK